MTYHRTFLLILLLESASDSVFRKETQLQTNWNWIGMPRMFSSIIAAYRSSVRDSKPAGYEVG